MTAMFAPSPEFENRDQIVSDNEGIVRDERGVSIPDILTWGFVLAVFLAFVALVTPKLRAFNEKNTITNEFRSITTGLNSYYENNYRYPSGSGWNWNKNNAYIEQGVIDKGWKYRCSSNTITLTTPPISKPRVATELLQQFQRTADQVTANGQSLDISLKDKPCPSGAR